FTQADKDALTNLNQVALDLKAGSAAAGNTSPTSPFGKVQPALESKTRLVNTAATLRTALVAYTPGKRRDAQDRFGGGGPGPTDARRPILDRSGAEGIPGLAAHLTPEGAWPADASAMIAVGCATRQ